MTRILKTGALALAATVAATMGFAQGNDPLAAAHAARDNLMSLYAYNLGTLGGMAQGAIPYDAAMASTAANNLAALTSLDQSLMWPVGSGVGEIEGSRVKLELWANMEDVMAKSGAMRDAAANMAAVAGTDLASLQAAMGAVGQACGACHQAYRAEE